MFSRIKCKGLRTFNLTGKSIARYPQGIMIPFYMRRDTLRMEVGSYSSSTAEYRKSVKKQLLKTAKPLEVPKINHILRKFYLKVHPDLYESYPVQRKKNEDSFKKINEFLQNYRDNVVNNTSSVSELEFYYKLNPGEFKHVKFSLMMPNPSLPSITRDFMVKRSITEFLSSFDIRIGEFDLGEYSPYYHSRNLKKDDISIIKYLISANLFFRGGKGELFHEWEKKIQSLIKKNESIKKEVISKMGTKFAILIPAIHFNGYTDRLMRLGEYFAKMADVGTCSSYLKGKTIVFVNKFVPWTESRIMMDVTCLDGWGEILRRYSKSYVEQVIRDQDEIEDLANSIQALLKLRSVEWDSLSFFACREDLKSFLKNWKKNVICNPEKWKLEFRKDSKIAIRLTGSDEISREDVCRSMQMANSTILVPVKMSIETFCQDIVTNISQLSEEFANFQRSLRDIKTYLKVQELYINPLLDIEKISDFMTRLREGKDELIDYFGGANICVSDQYGIDPEHKLVTIKYNFVY